MSFPSGSGSGAAGAQNVLVGTATVDANVSGVLSIPNGVPPTNGVPGSVQLYYIDTQLSNQIPNMSSDTAPSGVSSASSIWGAGREAWRAFDGNPATSWGVYTGSFPAWLKYQCAVAIKATAYEITTSSTYNPKTWKLQGSNNGSSWTDLDSQSDITSGWGNGVARRFYISNSTPYLYYQLYFTAINTPGSTDLPIVAFSLLSGTTGLMAKFPDNSSLLLGGPGAPAAYIGPAGPTGATGSITPGGNASIWTAYTPTLSNVTLGTGGIASFMYKTDGDSIRIKGTVRLGTGGALTGNFDFTLPAGFTVSTSKLVKYSGTGYEVVGYAGALDFNQVYNTVSKVNLNISTSKLYVQSDSGGAYSTWNATTPFTWTADDTIQIVDVLIPVNELSGNVNGLTGPTGATGPSGGVTGATGATGAPPKLRVSLAPASAELNGVSTEPLFQANVGTNFNWTELQYANAVTNTAQWIIPKSSTDTYSGGTLSLDILWLCTTNTSNVVWQIQMGARGDTAVFDAALAATRTISASPAPGTIGTLKQTTLSFTPDSSELLAGSISVFKLTRLGTDGADTCTGVARVVAVSLTEV